MYVHVWYGKGNGKPKWGVVFFFGPRRGARFCFVSRQHRTAAFGPFLVSALLD